MQCVTGRRYMQKPWGHMLTLRRLYRIEAKVSGLRGPYKKKLKQAPKAKSAKSKVWEVSEVVGSRGSLSEGTKSTK